MRLNSWSQVSTITPSQSLLVISQILTRARKQGHTFISLPDSATGALCEKVPFWGRSTFYHSGSNIPVLRLHHRGGQGREEKNQKQSHSHHHPTTQPPNHRCIQTENSLSHLLNTSQSDPYITFSQGNLQPTSSAISHTDFKFSFGFGGLPPRKGIGVGTNTNIFPSRKR